MADRQKIKAFVQDVLGCGCAEEVFEIIDLRQETMAGTPYDRINIGNRLLIYIFRTDDTEFVKKELPGSSAPAWRSGIVTASTVSGWSWPPTRPVSRSPR